VQVDHAARLVPKEEMARFQEEISEPVAGCLVPRIDLAERNVVTGVPAVMARLSIAPFS
ncbi:MAG: HPr kinase/phosphorylase, partial [Mesorhizobium sp.]